MMSPSANQPAGKDSHMSKRKASRLSMESIIEFILRAYLAVLALLVNMIKTIFRKWSAVDQASAIVCVGMFIVSLLTWNSYLFLCWMCAAACLSIAAVNGWQWNLLADLQSLRKGDLVQAVKGSNPHVDIVGHPVDIASSSARRQTTDVERTANLLKS